MPKIRRRATVRDDRDPRTTHAVFYENPATRRGYDGPEPQTPEELADALGAFRRAARKGVGYQHLFGAARRLIDGFIFLNFGPEPQGGEDDDEDEVDDEYAGGPLGGRTLAPEGRNGDDDR